MAVPYGYNIQVYNDHKVREVILTPISPPPPQDNFNYLQSHHIQNLFFLTKHPYHIEFY